MPTTEYRFHEFTLNPAERSLTRTSADIDAIVDLNSRYFDALLLLVSHSGALISKERFMREVWGGIPVTDEALTQCIRSLRRALGDRANAPRFIETVPKHGYRFIADVTHEPGQSIKADSALEGHPSNHIHPQQMPIHKLIMLGGRGTLGAGAAGLVGGVMFGALALSQPALQSFGAASVLVVMVSLTLLVALLGGAAVSFGIAISQYPFKNDTQLFRSVMGGALGGLLVGAFVKLIGIDTFMLLLGYNPGDITGAAEGLAIGAAVGIAYALVKQRAETFAHAAVFTILIGAIVGAGIVLAGGNLLAGSLEMVAHNLPASNIPKGHLSPVMQIVVGALEGALFTTAIVLATFKVR
ncbi:transcriptional regulator [Aliidiomarina shirensis]|uniref:Transcriptional regulator n=1 Tax=Aliidiomarina shirensis TaxID=1048642 RepID=A0A432WSY0_9GAMM|nr:transcriptional regulator [Aliidiomarina shirensis]RUO36880.1 transcriptional regulator [Aliidiomarina shirensis]